MSPLPYIQDPREMATAELPMRIRAYFEGLQSTICAALEEIDGRGKFGMDHWERPEGGGGLARVLEDGAVLEKAGVNTSTVFGALPASVARKMNVESGGFFATGVSLVLHPQSPMVPTVHMNYRYFERSNGDSWFGGGSDLTPSYLFKEDVMHFHSVMKSACDSIDTSFYPQFKKSCDEYFFNRHRNETRGVGGIFFDYLRGDSDKYFSLVKAGGDAFLDSYLPIVQRRMHESWGDPQRNWQLQRRGRYAEFNLVYDRGTAFGLETQGRIESILMSLPPLAAWRYNVQPPTGTPEAELVEVLEHPRDWLAS